jgi:hypothetical protein
MGGDDFLYQIHSHFFNSLFQVLDDGSRALTAREFSFPFSFGVENYNMFLPPSHPGKRIGPESISKGREIDNPPSPNEAPGGKKNRLPGQRNSGI